MNPAPNRLVPSRSLRPAATATVLGLALLTLPACSHQPTRPKLTPAAAARARDAQSACAPVKLPASRKFAAIALDTGLPSQGQWRDGFDLADMNGDGRLDLLHGPARKGDPRPHIFLGDGKGRFEEWKTAHFPPLPYDYGDAKAADFNGDGRLDIALAAHLRGITVLINEADGYYAPWARGLALAVPAETTLEPVFTARALAVADWNGDGRPDLLAVNEGPSRMRGSGVSAAFGLWFNRNGIWDLARPEQALQSFGDTLAAGDVNGDGRVDALLGTQVAGSRLVLQIGDGNLYQARELRSLPLQAAVTAVALHDFDRDGRAEVIDGVRAVEHSQFCSLLQFVRDAGSGKEQPTALWSAVSRDPVGTVLVGDIDGDGFDDLVALRQGGEILTFAGTRRGFRRDLNIAPLAQMNDCLLFDAKLADIDGDGRLELIAAYAGDDGGSGTVQCAGNGGFRGWRLQAAESR